MWQLCVCLDIEHLGSLKSTQEARVALGCASCNSHASFMLSKLPVCSISRDTHADAVSCWFLIIVTHSDLIINFVQQSWWKGKFLSLQQMWHVFGNSAKRFTQGEMTSPTSENTWFPRLNDAITIIIIVWGSLFLIYFYFDQPSIIPEYLPSRSKY